MKREVHGITKCGTRVFLGTADFTDDECQDFLQRLADYFSRGEGGWFNIKSSIYKVQGWIGIEITPNVYEDS